FHIGDIQEVVIRDRKALTKDGIFVIVATVDARTGKVQKSPDIISRGFVYLRENQDLLRQARYIAKKTVEDNTLNVHSIDYDFVKDQVTESIKKFLFKQTNKRPMVLPVILAA
ncbi:MAG: RNase J family beta-CASP ribonuclease, partial [Candidatus Pacebacteria bacterium]|nr:RNase J family beta-CASP ribonuclease [Candidatus Paceibacterota bacterium]